MIETLTLDVLKQAVAGTAAAFRCRTQLQPAGGEGDKVFPPTYAGAVYATETRRLPGREEPVECVLLDSVQSQANRMEEALQQAVDEGRLKIPVIEVDFSGGDLLTAVGKVTSLQAPHRIADAILRDSLLDGQRFRESRQGKRLDTVSLGNATPLFELCPTALVFGMWDSTGPKGGLGAKFQRAMVSEIVGIDAVFGVKTSSRIDPLQIRAAVKVKKTKDGSWTVAEDSKAKDAISPAEVNHSNIPPDISAAGGITVRSAEQMLVLSLPALRRLQFGVNNANSRAEINDAGHTVLAALGLCAAALAAEKGFDLRSRCLLWPTEPPIWEVLDTPGTEPKKFALTGATGIKLLNDAVEYAETLGLTWRKEPLVLTPSDQLVQLVKKSQELAAAQGAEAEGDV